MSLNRLRWICILAPATFILVVVMLSYVPHHHGWLNHPEEHALAAGIMVLSVFPFSLVVFRAIGNAQGRLARQNQELAALRQAAAVADERERIAREMHDGLGQMLGYVNTKAQAVQELLLAGKHEAAAAQAEQLARAAQGLHGDVREAILGLRDATALERGLLPVLGNYLEQFQDDGGVAVHLDAPASGNRFTRSLTTDLHLLRIVQEALTNVRRHAHARQAWVRFQEDEAGAALTVEDDGRGFAPSAQPGLHGGFGLRSMAERATAIGASFGIDSAPGHGTRVMVRLPRARAGQEEEADARPRGR